MTTATKVPRRLPTLPRKRPGVSPATARFCPSRRTCLANRSRSAEIPFDSARDTTCTAASRPRLPLPGLHTHTRFVDAHHVVHWADGGETSLENLVLLCRVHHRLVHEGGFHIERQANGKIRFRDGRDNSMPDAPLLPGFGTDFDAWLDRHVFEGDIDHDACRAKMDATDRMDWDMAVQAVM